MSRERRHGSPSRSAALPWASPWMALTALTWLVLVAADLLLLWNAQSVRVLGAFSPVDRATLIAVELVALLPFSMALAWCVDRISRLEAGREGRAVSWVATAGRGLAGGVAGLLLGASWLVFLASGAFLDGAGVRLWLASPLHTAEHGGALASGPLLLLPPLFFALGFAVLGLAIPRLAGRLSAASRRSLNRKFALVGATLLVLALLGGVRVAFGAVGVSDPQANRVYSAADRYRQVRVERTGPAVRALASAWEVATGGAAHGLPASDEIEARLDAIEPLERYVARASAGRSGGTGAEAPGVLVVIVESLRPDQLEAYGGNRSVMPHVDSLAREARVYLDAYTQSSHSNYADLSLLSSHYPLRSSHMHVYPEEVPYPRVLLHDILKGLGYRTAVFSSQNETWGGMANYLRTGRLDEFFHAETYRGPTYVPTGDPGFAGYAAATGRAGKIDDRATVEAAIDWIRADPEAPFYMYLNLQNSHAPYRTPDDFPRRFGPDSVDFEVGFGTFPREKVDVVRDLYANSLAYVDQQLGRLFRALKEDGRWGNTVVVLTGDTGQAFLEHGFAAHAGPLFDEVVRVPLVVRGPGAKAARDASPAEHVDLPPTVLDLLGLPPHPSFQGRSLLRSPGPSNGGRYLVAQSPLAHQYAVVADGWKLVRDVRRDRSLLFHLAEDPGETIDLSGERPERREALERRLGSWVRAQIEYYGTPTLYERRYPPKLVGPEAEKMPGEVAGEGAR